MAGKKVASRCAPTYRTPSHRSCRATVYHKVCYLPIQAGRLCPGNVGFRRHPYQTNNHFYVRCEFIPRQIAERRLYSAWCTYGGCTVGQGTVTATVPVTPAAWLPGRVLHSQPPPSRGHLNITTAAQPNPRTPLSCGPYEASNDLSRPPPRLLALASFWRLSTTRYAFLCPFRRSP